MAYSEAFGAAVRQVIALRGGDYERIGRQVDLNRTTLYGWAKGRSPRLEALVRFRDGIRPPLDDEEERCLFESAGFPVVPRRRAEEDDAEEVRLRRVAEMAAEEAVGRCHGPTRLLEGLYRLQRQYEVPLRLPKALDGANTVTVAEADALLEEIEREIKAGSYGAVTERAAK